MASVGSVIAVNMKRNDKLLPQLKQIAEREFEGNLSMAVRRAIAEFIERWKEESE